MTQRFEGQVCIVTGAGRGIGESIARRLADDGGHVVALDRDYEAVAAIASSIEAHGRSAEGAEVDVTDLGEIEALVSRILRDHGRVDVLINNVGWGGVAGPLVEQDPDIWETVLKVNLTSQFYCARAVLPAMLSRGYGRIVNMASIAGKEGNPMLTPYSAAKAGVIGLTKALGKELATTGVLVNCVCPAMIDTAGARSSDPAVVSELVQKIPMRRMGTPAEVAVLVAHLASIETSFSTGAVYDLSGGRATY